MDLKPTIWYFIVTVALACYMAGGAAIFQLLEAPAELRRQQVVALRLEKILENLTCVENEDLYKLINVIQELKGARLSRSNASIEVLDYHDIWSYDVACFFCMTVLTTIGYGTATPQTVGGRALCVLYALVGLPLCLVFLANIGAQVAKLNDRITESLVPFPPHCRRKHTMQIALLAIAGTVLLMVVPSVGFMYSEGWEYSEAMYFTFITLSTIGFGDLVIDDQCHAGLKVLLIGWVFVGLAWFSSIISTVQCILTKKIVEPSDEPDPKCGEHLSKNQVTLVEEDTKGHDITVGFKPRQKSQTVYGVHR